MQAKIDARSQELIEISLLAMVEMLPSIRDRSDSSGQRDQPVAARVCRRS
jgi:hypothetical protein